MLKIDVHQHIWSEPLVAALQQRSEFPFVRRERGMAVLFLAGERPYVIDSSAEIPARRAALLELDGLDIALVSISSPLGIESLPRRESDELIEAYHDGALSLGAPFGVWGSIALRRARESDVDRALDRGSVGISLPAGALGDVAAFATLGPVLDRLELRGAPLFVHPGPGLSTRAQLANPSLREPLWWPALTRYVAQMQAAWLAFVSAGRAEHPELRVVFSMLAGLAPLQIERLHSRGGPNPPLDDPLIFYDTSSYGPGAVRALAALVGAQQILYGSDRPVIEPSELELPEWLDWDATSAGTRRALWPLRARGGAAGPAAAGAARPVPA
jgi:6-methylsalicylate decarboxylase